MLRDRPGEPFGDLSESLLPGDPRERAAPLAPDPAHRVQKAVRRPRVRKVVNDLVAERAARVRMIGIAAQGHRLASPYGHDPAAGVRAIERARSTDPAFLPRGFHQSPAGRSRPRLIFGRSVRISTVIFATDRRADSGSGDSFVRSRAAARPTRGRSRT